MFTILTRTSNRPVFFNDCRASILQQTIKAQHLVSRDNPEDTYVEADTIVEVKPRAGRCHNLYFNTMRFYVPQDHPWIIHLDDDDRFTRPDALQLIKDSIHNDDSLILWRVKMPDGHLIPSLLNAAPTLGDITGIGFCCHVRHFVPWAGIPAGDFHVIATLYQKLKPVWLQDVLTEMQQIGHGYRNDKVYA